MPLRQQPQLSESWVVEDEVEDSADAESDETGNGLSDLDTMSQSPALSSRNATPSHRSQTTSSRQTSRKYVPQEPEFIMPSPNHSLATPESTRRRRIPTPSKPKISKHPSRPVKRSLRPTAEVEVMEEEPNAFDTLLSVLGSALGWLLDILTQALHAVKKPLSWLLAAYLFAGLLMLLQNLLTQSIYSALSPICRVPGISLLHLPICPDSHSQPSEARSLPEFAELMHTQSQFEDLLDRSAASVSLPSDMKKTETSIRDLKMLVRFSTLPTRQELEFEFDSFVEMARAASDQLQKFNAHVGRGVDMVLSNAVYTSKRLAELAATQQLAASQRGPLATFLHARLLAPFRPVRVPAETHVLDQYIQHSRIIAEQIDQLIVEAQALLLVLTNLEDRLDVVHGLAVRDGLAAQASRDEILGHLWTMLGGNRRQVAKWHAQVELLGRVSEVRGRALAHVQGTLLRLQAMGAELEELRTRVGSADVLGERRDIPIEVHIEAIRLGVERLSVGRKRNREIQDGYVNRVLAFGDKAGLGGGDGDVLDGKYIDG